MKDNTRLSIVIINGGLVVKKIEEVAHNNYNSSDPWPNNDNWHEKTFKTINSYVKSWLSKNTKKDLTILNVGSGKTSYNFKKLNIIYMDIIEDYVKNFDNYIVGSIDDIPLPNNSVDIIICVGSVINYTDALKSISEFHRILKNDGILILEFERSNSAEFLGTKNYLCPIFMKKYTYNNQEHLLWMYSETYILSLMKSFHFQIINKYRFHTFSSLLYRLGLEDGKAANYIKYDKYLNFISYFLSHTIIITSQKINGS